MSVSAGRAEMTEDGTSDGPGVDCPFVALAEVCEPWPGVRDPSRSPESTFRYIDISGVDNKRKRIIEARRINGKDAPSRARNVIRAGDVIIATTRPNLNAVAHVPQELDDEICSTGFCVLRPTERLRADYLFMFVQAPAFIDPLSDLVKGALYPAVSDTQVLAQRIPLPTVTEQERIAARLKKQLAEVERARRAATERLAAARALSAAFHRAAFGDSPPFSASPLIPTEPTRPGWCWHLLTNIARLATGHTPSRRQPSWWGGDVQWLQLPDIRAVDGGRVFTTAEQTNELGLANSSSVLLPKDTVCMSRTASVGFVTIMGRPMATSQDFVNWVCGPHLLPDFLMYLLVACRSQIRELGSGATHHSIYFHTVKSFAVCVPPFADQRRIAVDISKNLAEVDRLIAAAQAELALVDALPAALLREAFSPRG